MQVFQTKALAQLLTKSRDVGSAHALRLLTVEEWPCVGLEARSDRDIVRERDLGEELFADTNKSSCRSCRPASG